MLEIISVEEVQAYNQLGPCFMHDGKGFSNPKQSTIWPGTGQFSLIFLNFGEVI